MVSVRMNGKPLEFIPSGVISDGSQFSAEQKTEMAAFLRTFKPASAQAIGGTESAEKAQSAARKRLEKLKAQAQPEIVPFEYEGETVHIRHLNYQGLIDLALSVGRDGHNVLTINDESGVRSVTVAVLLACVCNEDGSPFFEYSDVMAYLDAPAAAGFVSALFMQCNIENPDILSTLKKT